VIFISEENQRSLENERERKETYNDEKRGKEQREVILLELRKLDPAPCLETLEDGESFEEHREEVVERYNSEGGKGGLNEGAKARAVFAKASITTCLTRQEEKR
jgi:hypothetical protein